MGSSRANQAATRDVRPIPEFPGYFATSDGQIIGPHGDPLPLCKEYPRVLIQRAGEPRHQRKRYYVHALVAAAFHGPRPPGHDVDHLDANERNPSAGNLAYRPAGANRARDGRTSLGPGHNANKTHCKRGHEFTPENTLLAAGKRYCRPCRRLRRASHV